MCQYANEECLILITLAHWHIISLVYRLNDGTGNKKYR